AAMFINCLASPIGVAVAWFMFKIHPALDLWRWMFASGAIPAIIALFLRAKLPESFVWQAQQKLQKSKSFFQSYRQLFTPTLRKTTICLCLSWFFLDISYYGIGLFVPAVLRAVNISTQADLLNSANALLVSTLFVNLFVVLGAFAGIFVIARMNPLKLQRLGFLLSFLGLFILSLSNISSHALSMTMIFTGFILFNFFVNFGPGITTYLLPAEFYDTEIKATGHGVAASCGKLGAAIGTVFLPILQFYLGIYYTVGLLATTLLAGWGLTVALNRETHQEITWTIKRNESHALSIE
ncbi:MAG: MFS transporter, partial [Legionella sp.]